ncbi:MAG TPA: hypothetical protein VFN49_03400 [Candidatus Aquilonibacter sp.]|nr:hypothetical protein [Candidatus Aquilonibacter sp.]
MARPFSFLAMLLTVACLLGGMARADIHDAAPADEYFGPFKESILGIRNHINDLERKADRDLAGAVRGIDNVELAIEDWHKHYPRDSWLPGFLDRVVHVYGRAHEINSSHCRQALALLEHDYPKTPQARDATAFASHLALAHGEP